MQPTVLTRPVTPVTVGDELTVRSLADLIRRRLDAGPDHDVADLVRGHPEIAKQSWYNYANPAWRMRTMLDPPSIRKLAAALAVRPEVVAVACLRDLGLWSTAPGGGRLAESLPPNADELSEEQQVAVLHVIRSMLDPGGVYEPTAPSGLSEEEEAEEAEGSASGDPAMSEVLREPEAGGSAGASGAGSGSVAGSGDESAPVGESGPGAASAPANGSANGSAGEHPGPGSSQARSGQLTGW